MITYPELLQEVIPFYNNLFIIFQQKNRILAVFDNRMKTIRLQLIDTEPQLLFRYKLNLLSNMCD